jgi:hypothetical protein
VETPRKFITANILLFFFLFFIIYLRGVSTNKTIIYFIAMQTYKELNFVIIHFLKLPLHRHDAPGFSFLEISKRLSLHFSENIPDLLLSRHVVKHGLDSLVKHGLDPISKTWTRLVLKTWTRLVKHGLD